MIKTILFFSFLCSPTAGDESLCDQGSSLAFTVGFNHLLITLSLLLSYTRATITGAIQSSCRYSDYFLQNFLMPDTLCAVMFSLVNCPTLLLVKVLMLDHDLVAEVICCTYQ